MTEYGAGALGLKISERFAAFLANITFEMLPEDVIHAARRGVLDYLGCAIAGSSHPTTTILIDALGAASHDRRCRILGRETRSGLLEAPIANGLMGHVLDFDDTHMGGVVLHASSPTLAALLGLSDLHPISGKDLITAYVAGFEAGVRIGHASPQHHDGGWHLTGTLGTLAAGAASARLLKVSPRKMEYALGVSATQAAGMQQNRGTMSKSLHAGKAASNGLLAALLAQKGFTSSTEIIEGKKGFSRIYSRVSEPEAVLTDLGERWEITRNGHKPYACGVVLHPLIDGVIALAPKIRDAGEILSIEAVVNPKMVAITGIKEPLTGLESKFSLFHSAAVALLDRTAGIAQYSDERAAAADVVMLRKRVTAVTDESIAADQARLTIRTKQGLETVFVEHATGTHLNPMSDEALVRKFEENVGKFLPPEIRRELIKTIFALETVQDVAKQITALSCLPGSN